MILTFEIPDNAKDIKVIVTHEEKPTSQNPRYNAGYWNGLQGGRYYGQYFLMDDENRMREMVEVASALAEYRVSYTLNKLKTQYRIMISSRDYFNMDERLKERILRINSHHESVRFCADGETEYRQ